MGEAKRRKKLDPNFGKEFFVSVQRSDLTGKWLIIAHLFGKPRVISPHFKKEDAQIASQIVVEVFSQYSPQELRDDPKKWSEALASLDYEDDDEPLGQLKQLPDGSMLVDVTGETMKNIGSVFNEHELFSESAKQSFQNKWNSKSD